MTRPPCWAARSTAGILALLLLCLVAISVLGLARPIGASIWMDSVNGAGHFFFFGLLAMLSALATFRLWPGATPSAWLSALIGLGLAVFAGGALEWAQMAIPGRSASWQDLTQDVLGAVAAVSLLHFTGLLRTDRDRPRRSWASLFVLSATFFWGMFPLAHCLLDYYHRNRAMPLLMDFHASWAQRFLHLDDSVQLQPLAPPADWPKEAGANVARLQIGTKERFAGWAINEPYPIWPADSDLVLDLLLRSPEQQRLVLRVHDATHNNDFYDRFNRELPLRQGFQQVRIPVRDIRDGPRSRELDLRHIRGFHLFAVDPSLPIEITIGNVRLERGISPPLGRSDFRSRATASRRDSRRPGSRQ